jgi:hypothetical protein
MPTAVRIHLTAETWAVAGQMSAPSRQVEPVSAVNLLVLHGTHAGPVDQFPSVCIQSRPGAPHPNTTCLLFPPSNHCWPGTYTLTTAVAGQEQPHPTHPKPTQKEKNGSRHLPANRLSLSANLHPHSLQYANVIPLINTIAFQRLDEIHTRLRPRRNSLDYLRHGTHHAHLSVKPSPSNPKDAARGDFLRRATTEARIQLSASSALPQSTEYVKGAAAKAARVHHCLFPPAACASLMTSKVHSGLYCILVVLEPVPSYPRYREQQMLSGSMTPLYILLYLH